MPLAEAQSEWVADLLVGPRHAAAGGGDAGGDRGQEAQMRKRYVASKRHTIQVDFHPYLREIRRERKRARAAGPDEASALRPPGRARPADAATAAPLP